MVLHKYELPQVDDTDSEMKILNVKAIIVFIMIMKTKHSQYSSIRSMYKRILRLNILAKIRSPVTDCFLIT